MSAQSDQPFQFHGFQTTIDVARQQNNQDNAHKVSVPSYSTSTSHLSSRPVDFVRPSVVPSRSRLTASEIRPVAASISEKKEEQQPETAPSEDYVYDPCLFLDDPRYGLSPALVSNFASVGVRSIYPWQASCLLAPGLLEGEKHLIYTAPTGGGKSLVADVLMLKRIIENPSRKAILVLPYVALVQEKSKWLKRMVQDVEKRIDDIDDQVAGAMPYHQRWKKLQKSIRVTGFFGGSRSTATWANTDIAVCTIEKANSLINTAIEEHSIGDLGVVVLDELHMLDDEHRGYLLELMVTKILLLQQDIQIIGMSATLSNTELLAEWMNANYYISTYRPIPIEDYLVYENAIYPAETSRQLFQTITQSPSMSTVSLTDTMPPHRIIQPPTSQAFANPTTNAMVALSIDTAAEGYSALVFCGSRQSCQLHASIISEAMPVPAAVDPDELSRRLDLLAELRSLPSGLDPVLENTLVRGVAFYHAGMTTEERDFIGQAYDHGVLRVLIATCSLAAGVNLPARRVIINGVRMGRDLVGPAMLRQMCGRAGRKGKDEAGETYLICGKSELQTVCDLLEAGMPAIESCLTPEKRGLKRAILEAIATGLVSGFEAIKDYVKCTLLYRTTDKKIAYSIMNSALQELVSENLLHQNGDESYVATGLGQAIVASAFAPEDGLFINEELNRALQAFVMDGDMHIFYMFTPLQVATTTQIDWPIFRDQLDNLDESGLRALQFVGVQPGFVNRMVQSGSSLKEDTPEQIKLAAVYRRAYTALQLRDLSNEVPLSVVASRYRTPRGTVQSLAQHCHGFAASMIKFCQRMGWGMLAAVLDHMRVRLEAGARADLLEMAQVTYVKGRLARLLRDKGFQNLRALAKANANDLVPILMMVNPRKAQRSQAHPSEAQRYAKKLLAKAEVIVASANKIWEREMQVELDE
ncbi:DNA-directed DNA polymerase theta [Aspergillus bombycis]|uniref:DNA-directed DNA polymerase theta n=1 Tax=Aspergillus bombycis TaxID=109264 RepID=A0A1F8A2G3_9EURO|nr:DNA-directed DNA polymerase theta [Aspergillus bombycis]OGM45508.1 DNA-directed DNA polymerase theta [Aspergillus bombycis]